MKIHITMQSGAHFKVVDDDSCNKFLNQWNVPSPDDPNDAIEVRVDGWKMILVRQYIEAIAIKELP